MQESESSEQSARRGSGITRRGAWMLFIAGCILVIAIPVVFRAVRSAGSRNSAKKNTVSDAAAMPVTDFKFYAVIRTPKPDEFPISGAAVVVTVILPDGGKKIFRGETNEAGRVELYYIPGEVVEVRISRKGFNERVEKYFRPPGVRPEDKPLRVILDPAPAAGVKTRQPPEDSGVAMP